MRGVRCTVVGGANAVEVQSSRTRVLSGAAVDRHQPTRATDGEDVRKRWRTSPGLSNGVNLPVSTSKIASRIEGAGRRSTVGAVQQRTWRPSMSSRIVQPCRAFGESCRHEPRPQRVQHRADESVGLGLGSGATTAQGRSAARTPWRHTGRAGSRWDRHRPSGPPRADRSTSSHRWPARPSPGRRTTRRRRGRVAGPTSPTAAPLRPSSCAITTPFGPFAATSSWPATSSPKGSTGVTAPSDRVDVSTTDSTEGAEGFAVLARGPEPQLVVGRRDPGGLRRDRGRGQQPSVGDRVLVERGSGHRSQRIDLHGPEASARDGHSANEAARHVDR